jgi:hypothetical protein
MMALLAERYHETPRMAGLTGGPMMIITASPEGTWSALIVQPDGTACLVASGADFEVIAPEPQGTEG